MIKTNKNRRGVSLSSYLLLRSRSILLAAAIGLAVNTWALDLSTVTTATTIPNSTIVTGTLGSNVKLTIEANATVTLSGVTINGVDNQNYSWAGLTCAGNATIILAEGTANTIKGFDSGYPGVYVPKGRTLTIRGNGSLTASSNGMGAGIGGGLALSCGNIVIEGGNINATGGGYSAAIGSGFGFLNDSQQYLSVSCGDITISGGNICATGGEDGGAGIGCGMRPLNQCGVTCGNITISGGSVTAVGGGRYGAGIGSGYMGSCCGIAIFGGVVNATGGSEYGAGIGSGAAGTCGGIALMGGTITAAGNGEEAAGIGGGGRSSSCGMISIEADVTSVTASEGTPIGAGNNGTCVAVKIGDVLDDTTSGSTRTITSRVVNLANITEYTMVADGKIITGTLAANVKVSIADGATVTLRDVTINGGTGDWAGLTCLGNATIIIEGANSVTGYDKNPGIYVPDGYTLTVKGEGSLTARADWYSTDCAAGIGGGWGKSCGNIVIEGGTITAVGGMRAAGIGGGFQGGCGDITITKGVTSVTAVMGSDGVYSIGRGQSGSCGTVTIGGEEGEIEESLYTYIPTRINLVDLTGNYTAADGEVLFGETAHKVTVPGGASVMINGVEVAGAGTVNPAPTFSAGGKAATTEFVQGANGKWTLTTFAEMSNDALGSEVANSQIKVYAASTVEGLNSASPMTSGVEVKEKKSAVKTTIEVTPPSGAQSQFFKVKFGE